MIAFYMLTTKVCISKIAKESMVKVTNCFWQVNDKEGTRLPIIYVRSQRSRLNICETV